MSLRAFLVRRSARILPLYFVALATYCAFVFGTSLDTRQETFRSALPYYLTFLQEVPLFQNVNRPFGVAWSLGIEEKFYLLWPVLAFVVARTFALRMTAVISLGGLFFLASLQWAPGRYVSPYADIIIGCGLAILLGRPATCRRVAAVARPSVATTSAIATIGVMLWPGALPQSLGLLLPVCVALALPGLAIGAGLFSRLLENRSLRWLGRVSYGIYLFHQLFLKVAERLPYPIATGSWATSECSPLVSRCCCQRWRCCPQLWSVRSFAGDTASAVDWRVAQAGGTATPKSRSTPIDEVNEVDSPDPEPASHLARGLKLPRP